MDANIKNQFYADRLNRAKIEYSMLFNLYEKFMFEFPKRKSR